jgi:hypothetical protein
LALGLLRLQRFCEDYGLNPHPSKPQACGNWAGSHWMDDAPIGTVYQRRYADWF